MKTLKEYKKDYIAYKRPKELVIIEDLINGKYKLSKVEYQTEEICLAAVKYDGFNLRYVKDQTYDICIAAVKQNGRVLPYVYQRSLSVMLEAVKQNGTVLSIIKEQTEELCLAAVEQDIDNFKYINKDMLNRIED